MKKIAFIAVVVTMTVVLMAALAVPALAVHTQDPQGRQCALCHATHQGVTRYLLSPTIQGRNLATTYGAATVSTSCLACHDGTQSRGVTGGNERTMFHSGVFDLGRWPQEVQENFTAHQVDINPQLAVPVPSAPGNRNLPHYGTHNNAPLSCASCHNPHGAFGKTGISHAYLQPNPNSVISGRFNSNAPDWGNQWEGKDYTQIVLNRIGEGLYANEESAPWLRPYVMNRGAAATHYINYPVAVEIGGSWVFHRVPNAVNTVNFSINPLQGLVRFDGAVADPGTATLTARVFKPILVQVTGTFNGVIYDESGAEKTLTGIRIYSPSINQWCGACHGYYNIASKGDGYHIGDEHFYGHSITSRPWSQDYATPMSSDGRMNCLSCHYAHGTRSDLMVDSLKQIIGQRTYQDRFGNDVRFVDSAPANKRYFGGSVCMRCHYESHGTYFMNDNPNRPEQFQWQ